MMFGLRSGRTVVQAPADTVPSGYSSDGAGAPHLDDGKADPQGEYGICQPGAITSGGRGCDGERGGGGGGVGGASTVASDGSNGVLATAVGSGGPHSSGGCGSISAGGSYDASAVEATGSTRLCCFSLRMLALTLLVAQNCAAVLLMRYTQTRSTRSRAAYSTVAVIAMTEVLKVAVCAAQAVHLEERSLVSCLAECGKPEGIKMMVPAALYTLQNKLLFVALANLEATLFQVTYQLKLLITALFMVALLNKKLTLIKWGALVLLFLGIVFTQLRGSGGSTKRGGREQQQDVFVGLLAVVTCATSSAFASVYFEKVVKTSAASLAMRNVQLGIYSAAFALFSYFVLERRAVERMFDGFDAAVWVLVLNQAIGGILVAVVIKYADNIWKGIATAAAIVVSGIVSYICLDFEPTANFLLGALLVIVAVAMYAHDAPTPPILDNGVSKKAVV